MSTSQDTIRSHISARLHAGLWIALIAIAVLGCTQRDRLASPDRKTSPGFSNTPSTPAPVPGATEVALDQLPVWAPPPTGVAAGALAVRVHAADASAEHVRVMLAGPDVQYLALASSATVTGRIDAPDRRAAAAAMAAAFPDAGLEPLIAHGPLRGRGVQVDLDFVAVTTGDVLRLLADVGGVNLVVDASALPRTTVRVRQAPWDGVAAAIFAAHGLTQHKSGNTVYATPTGARLNRTLTTRTRSKLDIDVHDARASDILQILRVHVPHAYVAPCGSGKPIAMRMRRVRPAHVLTAVELLTAVTLTRGDGAEPCAPIDAARLSGSDLADFRLAALTLVGEQSAALFRAADGRVVVVQPGDVFANTKVQTIRAGFVVVEQNDISRALRIGPPLSDSDSAGQSGPLVSWGPIDDIASARLSATVIAGDQSSALIESGDVSVIVRANQAGVAIDPGRVVLSTDGRHVAELFLRWRAK